MNAAPITTRLSLAVLCGLPVATHAITDDTKIQSALSAAPASITASATVLDWPGALGGQMPVLREGSNDWYCLPDMPDTSGNDPMCLDKVWLDGIEAWINHSTPETTRLGFGYMLQGGSSQSNTDPYATEATADNEWIDQAVPHLMLLVPDKAMLQGLPVTPDSGGPWVMWRDTPYVHVMVPMPLFTP
jgi:hypothetical protein